MKSVNLLSLINIINNVSEKTKELYFNNYGIIMKDQELDDINALVTEILYDTLNASSLDGYFVGYIIPQIGKEFDLLRFGKTQIINIEVKRMSSKEKIKEQLIRNRYYLKFLNKEVLNFAYISQQNRFYFLDGDEVKQINNNDFIKVLNCHAFENINNIDNLFDPTNYLVSPFNSTNNFITGNYFLTSQQEQIKRHVFSLKDDKHPRFISIYGSAGTGKTLLTYDIAKAYMDVGLSVIIFHCGNLNRGQIRLNKDFSWTIKPIKSISTYIEKEYLLDYDLIIFDEVQRIYEIQLKDAIEQIKKSEANCIFSYDSNQCLSNHELNRDVASLIEVLASSTKYKLTEKIRSNKEIAAFIRKLFNLKSRVEYPTFCNVEITYFIDNDSALNHLKYLKESGWKIINYTASTYDNEPFDSYQMINEENAHYVIGQEFDNVVAIIDKYFYYNSEGILSYKKTTYYHSTKMLFQIVTRTRKRLHIIIINNELMLNRCMDIIGN